MKFEIAIIGGGPAGATLATYLARSGKSVAVVEKSKFPRFHTGESLLPATMPILEDLGLYQQMRSNFLNKPGGCWYYDDKPLTSNFANCSENASFKNHRHALMVERSKFDNMLLEHAKNQGATVYEQHKVKDMLWEEEKLTGLKVIDLESQQTKKIHADMVFDCSGYHSVIANKLKLRKPNKLKKMAVFAHYEVEAIEEKLKKGWFVGQMIYDGWLWLIPISQNRISIGVVTTLDNYKKAKTSPEEFLDSHIQSIPLSQQGLSKDIKRVSEVHLYGNVGYSSEKIFGNGWALVGDAALFIDPCYSTGVHLAMESAQKIAKLYLEYGHEPKSLNKAFVKYEKKLRQYEKLTLMLVEGFYMASRSPLLRRIAKAMANIKSVNQKFVHFTGGDIASDPFYIKNIYYMQRFFSIFNRPRTTQQISEG